LKIVNRAAIERLIKAGAFDSLSPRRAALIHVLPKALQAAGELQHDRRHGQRNFFDVAAGSAAAPEAAAETLPDVPEWPDSEKLKNEKEALDFYLSSHPLAQYEDKLRLSQHRVDRLGELGPNQEVMIGGMLTEIRFMNTKQARNGNSRYVRCKLEDFTGAVECVMWPDDFARHKDEFREDRVCFVKGVVERNRDQPGLVLTRVLTVEQAQRELTRGLLLTLNLGVHDPNAIDAICTALRRTPGSCPVYLKVVDATGKRTVLKAGNDFGVNLATFTPDDLGMLLGAGGVVFTGAVNGRNGK
jgi:DNA polymerase-3 subunit alpha